MNLTRTMLSTAINLALRDPASVARMFYLEARVGLLGHSRKG